jgi:hypothetical protein
MMAKTLRLGRLALMWGVVASCSGGGTAGADGAAGTAGGAGTATFSCTLAASDLCTQLIIPSTGPTQGQEQQQCTTLENGVSGTGCAPTGLVGCCHSPSSNPSKEEQCYYSASAATTGMSICNNGKTWSSTL